MWAEGQMDSELGVWRWGQLTWENDGGQLIWESDEGGSWPGRVMMGAAGVVGRQTHVAILQEF